MTETPRGRARQDTAGLPGRPVPQMRMNLTLRGMTVRPIAAILKWPAAAVTVTAGLQIPVPAHPSLEPQLRVSGNVEPDGAYGVSSCDGFAGGPGCDSGRRAHRARRHPPSP